MKLNETADIFDARIRASGRNHRDADRQPCRVAGMADRTIPVVGIPGLVERGPVQPERLEQVAPQECVKGEPAHSLDHEGREVDAKVGVLHSDGPTGKRSHVSEMLRQWAANDARPTTRLFPTGASCVKPAVWLSRCRSVICRSGADSKTLFTVNSGK